MTRRICKTSGWALTALLLSVAFLAPALQAAESQAALEKKNMDLTVRPGDDFFRYANGAWIRALAMPADKSESTPSTRCASRTAPGCATSSRASRPFP